MTARRFLRKFQAMARRGQLWCPSPYCEGSEKQPLHQTEHDASLYRCSCCGTDWTLSALADAYLRDDVVKA